MLPMKKKTTREMLSEEEEGEQEEKGWGRRATGRKRRMRGKKRRKRRKREEEEERLGQQGKVGYGMWKETANRGRGRQFLGPSACGLWVGCYCVHKPVGCSTRHSLLQE